MVLVYGLAVAPVLHAVVGHGGGLGGPTRAHVHEGGPGTHTHAPEQAEAPGKDASKKHGHRHGAGSVEHLLAVAASWTVVLPPRPRWVSWWVEAQRAPELHPVKPLRSTAVPQGP
jgi:hypothetical protein